MGEAELLADAFRSLRRASSTSTGSVRKLVAVGIERLSSMKRASVAAGPRIGLSSAPAGAVGRGRPVALDAREHVVLGHAPARAGPLDRVEVHALRRRRCEPRSEWRWRRPFAGRGRRVRALGRPRPVAPARSRQARAPLLPPRCGTGRCPRQRSRPASTRISAIVPATGEGTSASTLSVEISTSGSSTATASPACLATPARCLRRPSRPSPGRRRRRARPRRRPARRPRRLRRGPAPPVPRRSTSISPSTAPTCDRRSGSTRILDERSGGRSGHLGVDLVGRHLHQRLVGLDAVADLLQPLEHRAFGDRLPHRGHGDLNGRRPSGHPVLKAYPGGLSAFGGDEWPPRRRKLWGWGYEDQQPAHAEVEQAAARGSRAPRLRPGRSGAPGAAARTCELPPAAPRPARVAGEHLPQRPLRARRRTPTASPTATWCAPSAAASTTRPTSWRIRATRRELEQVLDWCADAGAAAIPFGGGTSVVGGVEPRVPRGYAGA